MILRPGLLLAALALTLLPAVPVQAHPHVFVIIKSEVLYAPDGKVTGIRHHWTFDEMFSAMASQGLDTNKDGTLSREELAGLADINVSSLKEYDYFTFANADGKKAMLSDPIDYFLDHDKGALTLHFTLPVKTPAPAKIFEVEIYDATYFVSFGLADKDPVALVAAPAACKVESSAGKGTDVGQGQRLSESFFNQLDANSTFGAQFANRIAVKCP